MESPLRLIRAGVILLAAVALTTGLATAAPLTTAERVLSLSRAASDPGLTDWQRDFYRERLAECLAGATPAGDDLARPLAAADAPQPVWSLIADTPRRQGHSVVCDTTTGRLFAFGGRNGTQLYATAFVLDPLGAREWHAVPAQGTPPPARMAHAAVIDYDARRLIVYGGTDVDGSYLADVWALTLDGPPTWTELTPAGDPPPARANALSAWDALHDRWLVYGGGNGGFAPLEDLWTLTLGESPAWSAIDAGGAKPQWATAGALGYDPARHRLVLAGTQTVNYSTYWTLWMLPLDTPSPTWSSWTVPYSGPSTYSVSNYVYAFDWTSDQLVCWASDYNSYCYTLGLGSAGHSWVSGTTTGSLPPSRVGRATAVDPLRRRWYFAGGANSSSSSGRAVSDVAALDLNTLGAWTAVSGEPGPRDGHSLAFDPLRGRVFMFGGTVDSLGSGYSGYLSNGIWSLESGSPSPAWAPEVGTGGPVLPREGAVLAVDTARDRLLLFGGANGSTATNEVWTRPLSGGTAWTRLVVAGTLPHQRSYAGAVYDPDGDRLLVHGGYEYSYGYLGDLWALSLAGTPHWTKLINTGGPGACSETQLSWDSVNQCLYVVGGRSSSYYSSGGPRAGTVWKFTPAPSPSWQWVSNGLPAASSYSNDEVNCAAFYDAAQGRLLRVAYLYDYYNSKSAPVVTALAPAADTAWTTLACGGAPPVHSMDARGVFDPEARRSS